MAKSTTPLEEVGDVELLGQLAANREELFNLRFQLVTGALENSSRIKLVKKQIARILTVLRAREIAAAEALSANDAAEKENA